MRLKNIETKLVLKTAINFSIASTALSGGDIGWINSSSLTGNFLDILKDMNIGDVSDPIVRSNKIVFIKLLIKGQLIIMKI